ncbi:glycine cleavage system protein GcvH [Salinibacterium sp. SYSU T00001]|uniref:glycine cleavage system protein GcvH n=1 Tax=Homoserinimonas sedimenticola TaxID=2986805 RepID=UPI0022366D7F|nr:glycine cleavage system protein GcvH [Salinibacterium sedimenticola]MCW4386487.1 glycine cleavage system protein GcvH [Salinibacterium sedimenticola]
MSEQAELKYTAEHEWVRIDGDTLTVGITAYAADKLGEVVFVDVPEAGASVSKGKVVAEVESTKSVGEVYAPVDGTIVESNSAVADNPELINEDPTGAGWLFTIRIGSPESFDASGLLDADAYAALTRG